MADPSRQYDWDRSNKGHIAAHHVESSEVEEVLANEPVCIETRIDAQSGEERVLELGHTNTGRARVVRGVDTSWGIHASGDSFRGKPQNQRGIPEETL